MRSALEQLSIGVARLAPYKSTGTLIVSSDAAFARYWLMPRLSEFRRLRPDIEIWLDTSERLVDFDRQEVEFVIGRLRPIGGDHTEEAMFDEHLGPCQLAGSDESRRRLAVEDLAKLTLLHDERRENWLVWLRSVGAHNVNATGGPHFSDPALVIDAVRAGQGIALVSDVLATDEIRSGRFHTPFDQWIAVANEYRFSYPLWLARDDAVLAFSAFIRTQVGAHRSQLSELRLGHRAVVLSAADNVSRATSARSTAADEADSTRLRSRAARNRCTCCRRRPDENLRLSCHPNRSEQTCARIQGIGRATMVRSID